jgi:hypothetical protein
LSRTSRNLAALLLSAVTAMTGMPSAALAIPSPRPSASPPRGVGQCAAGLGIGLLEVPRATLSDPRARNYIIDVVKPGADFTRTFQVCNGTDRPLAVELYPDAAAITSGNFVLAPGRGTNDLASWMTVTPASLTVPSGKAVVAKVRITVPDDASAGERYAGVIADSPAIGNGGVSVGGRVGIRVYLDVSTGGAPKSDFTIDSLQAVRRTDGTPAVLAKVHNTGARALDMRGTLTLSDGPGGLSAGPFDAQLGTTLAPGDTAPVAVPLNKAISGGPWHAVISMRSGLLERRAEGDLTFPDKADSAASPVRARPLALYEDRGVVIPIAVVLLGILALLLLAIFARQLLKKRRLRPARRAAG